MRESLKKILKAPVWRWCCFFPDNKAYRSLDFDFDNLLGRSSSALAGGTARFPQLLTKIKKATWRWQLFIEAPLSHQAIERLFQNPFPAENYRECVRSGSTQEGIHLCNTCSKLTIQADVKKTELLFLTDRLLDILKSKSKLVRARVKSVVTQRLNFSCQQPIKESQF